MLLPNYMPRKEALFLFPASALSYKRTFQEYETPVRIFAHREKRQVDHYDQQQPNLCQRLWQKDVYLPAKQYDRLSSLMKGSAGKSAQRIAQ
ncbi:hypothetical protein BJI49_08610 [Acetobacter pasteurianus]|nr:hypothetical protein BJI49_08610 [Acetobacter pasteurianus]